MELEERCLASGLDTSQIDVFQGPFREREIEIVQKSDSEKPQLFRNQGTLGGTFATKTMDPIRSNVKDIEGET